MLLPTQAIVGPNVILDARLALFHEEERWLAVADLHFGYELSQRAAGRLVPFWGMQPIEERLCALLDEYRPERLIVVGDLVHDRTAANTLNQLLARIRGRCEVISIAGNHDRQLAGSVALLESWESESFHFHHGHCATEITGRTQIIGHHHPAAILRDGAGLRLKLPAFVQQRGCWILPAFSPWSSGTIWTSGAESQIWLCAPRRILHFDEPESIAV